MYIIELSFKLSPVSLLVHRKELVNAQILYNQVRESMSKGQSSLLELTCEKFEGKKITVLVSELFAVQMYEENAVGGTNKKPGFSFED